MPSYSSELVYAATPSGFSLYAEEFK